MGIAVIMRNPLEVQSEPPLLTTAFTRFLAGLIMQVKMSKELKEGLTKMKYCLNHTWKFQKPIQAFLAGLLQTSMIMFVVILNYFAILLEENPIEIVMNFLALMVISELDDYFFEAHGDMLIKEMISEQDVYKELYKI